MNSRIGKIIKGKLKNKNMSTNDLASLLKIDEQIVQDWIDGAKIPNYKQLVKISSLLDIEMGKMVNFEEINTFLNKKNLIIKILNSIIILFVLIIIILSVKLNKNTVSKEDFKIYEFNATGEKFEVKKGFFVKHNDKKYIELSNFTLKKKMNIKTMNINVSYNDTVWAIKEYKYSKDGNLNSWLKKIELKEYAEPRKGSDSFANYSFNSFPGNMKIEVNYCLTDNECFIDILNIESKIKQPKNRLE